ncbi:UvrD-helicase domain-containing protein [Treponema sp. C6A8]|uniref:UvrD-helicase domain-containing protein n=1 Tax=Treponema sp. C6A8 TaxID=1410609 RepID=UPI0009DD137A|nr:UvrD-helicase domain-containing protein [Treponema sp. C6A8]
MSILNRIFGAKENQTEINSNELHNFENPKLNEVIQLYDFLTKLLSSDSYIAKSDYLKKIESCKESISYFQQLKTDDLLSDFCKKNKVSNDLIISVLEKYSDIVNIVTKHNEDFISEKLQSEKTYLDTILHDIDKNIMLDDDQRRVVLTDEDYCLVIAGAGAGKTTTVAAKVKYLVEKKNINPAEILVVSFTNKAVGELKEKINKQLKIESPITTFHSTGNAILQKDSEEKLTIVQNEKLYFVLEDYFRDSVLQNQKLIDDLIKFFATYFDAPIQVKDKNELFTKLSNSNFSTMKSEVGEVNYQIEMKNARGKEHITIQNEVLRSQEEVQIANFLYLNNIEYEYEPRYKFNIEGAKKPYTPDFIIRQNGKEAYIEHFGITQSGNSNRYSKEELEKYKKAVHDKVDLHKQHGTTLLYTFSEFIDGRTILEHLKEQLQNSGFILNPRDNKEVMQKISNQDGSRYIRKLINLVDRFISNFKTNGYPVEKFDEWSLQSNNVRTKLFLGICKECYLEYERYLHKNNAIDFSDMINKSAKLLRESKNVSDQIKFKYIIVDEYQDISRQRFDLVGALHDVTSAKIIAVGDDWQSIYAFSGSDITLFTKFSEIMGYAELLKITKTYRNSQEVIDIAGNFIQKNTAQIKKSLKSPKTINEPVIIYTYDAKQKFFGGNANYNLAKSVETAIEQIIEFNKMDGKDSKKQEILLLGRFGFDGKNLERSSLFECKDYGNKIKSLKYPELKITFMTAHASKGLGYDNVIVINGKNETYGFPAKIENDPVLNYVVKQDNAIEAAEERRLFYVAMTRTKNRVYFIAPEQNPSEFLLEIKHDYKNVVLKGDWSEEVKLGLEFKKSCPMCGYPLQHKVKAAYGLNLWICMNDPEVCDFMTNRIEAGKLAVQKCDMCDGYLVAKLQKDGRYFLGCTNYKSNGKGCGKIIWNEDYYRMNGLSPEPAPKKEIPKGYEPKNK